MRKDLTDINVVLDRSGSMSTVADDTIGGFNKFLEEQKKATGEARVTLVQFDDVIETVYDAIDVKEVKDLDSTTFVPRGYTALLDAIGQTIVKTGQRLAAMDEKDRPGNVIFVILTDGGENASREYVNDKIKSMIEEQTKKYNWDFVFIGANQDAIATGGSLGIGAGNSMTYMSNAVATQNVFHSMATKMSNYRSGDASLKSSFFDADDRAKAVATDPTN